MVNAAKYFGYVFKGRDEENNIELTIGEKEETMELLNVIEFTSLRKRMTVMVKTGDNKVKVMCKGADSIILPRLDKLNKHNKDILQFNNEFLENAAKSGLRTLLLCEKEITL